MAIMFLRDLKTDKLVLAEIVLANLEDLPLKKSGWNFNWRKAYKTTDTEVFTLRLLSNPQVVQGVLQLRIVEGMLIMNLLEIAPHNLGSKQKRYDYVAGCLIAFACKASFALDSNYKGFLTFESKTTLISWYVEKYGAQVAMGQKMFIDPQTGKQLIETYLNRKGNEDA